MCIIVDCNLGHKVFCKVPCQDFEPVHRGLFGNSPGLQVRLVYGGKLKEEYWRVASMRQLVVVLDRKGRARKVADAAVEAEEARLVAAGGMRSDDPHVLALARVAGVSLVCTLDADLVADFTNPAFISGPGKVYQRRAHSHLLGNKCRSIAKGAR